MNTKRILIVVTILVVVAALGLTVAYAQGGRGRGNGGNGGNGSDQQGNGSQSGPQDGTGFQNGQQDDNAGGNQTGPQDGTGFQYGQQGGSRGGQGKNFMNNPQGGNQYGLQGGGNNAGLHLNLPPASTDELPQDVIDLMIDGWLDEQHAYAVYTAAVEQLGDVRPFANILNAEAQHISAWETLFERYGIAVPDVPAFDVPDFASVNDACAIGAAAEIANSDMYDTMMTAFAPYPDLLFVAQNLQAASEQNHLSAFTNCPAG